MNLLCQQPSKARLAAIMPLLSLSLLLRALACMALQALAALHLYRKRNLRPGSWQRVTAALPVALAFLLPPLFFRPATEPAALVVALNCHWPCNAAVRHKPLTAGGVGSQSARHVLHAPPPMPHRPCRRSLAGPWAEVPWAPSSTPASVTSWPFWLCRCCRHGLAQGKRGGADRPCTCCCCRALHACQMTPHLCTRRRCSNVYLPSMARLAGRALLLAAATYALECLPSWAAGWLQGECSIPFGSPQACAVLPSTVATLHVTPGVALYAFAALALECSSFVASVAGSGRVLLHPFDRPYLSSSLACICPLVCCSPMRRFAATPLHLLHVPAHLLRTDPPSPAAFLALCPQRVLGPPMEPGWRHYF